MRKLGKEMMSLNYQPLRNLQAHGCDNSKSVIGFLAHPHCLLGLYSAV